MDEWPFDPLPRKHFNCVVADPPWQFKSHTALQMENWNSRRDAEKHYDVMTIDDLKALPVGDIASKDAHLFLWTTGPCLQQSFDVMNAWGFKYSAIAFAWVKMRRKLDPTQLRLTPTADSDLHVGLGLTTRHNVELCLLGRRGNARRNAKDVREVILSPVREHSRKPDQAFERIQRYCDGPYLDLFSRQKRPGWSSWGNETERFDAAS